MVDTLLGKKCAPCRGGVPSLTPQEAEHFHVHVPQWEVRDQARRIERTFRFRNFREAFALVQKVGELAEAEGHHPDISFGWGYVTVVMQTKKSKDCMKTISSWLPRSTNSSNNQTAKRT